MAHYEVCIKCTWMTLYMTFINDKVGAIKKCLEAKRNGQEYKLTEWTSKDLTEEVNAL